MSERRKMGWGQAGVEFQALAPDILRELRKGRPVVEIYEELQAAKRVTMKIQTFYKRCAALTTEPPSVSPSDRIPSVSPSRGEGAKIIRAAAPRGVKDLRATGEDLLAAVDEENPNGEYDG
ncbi:hypothetical protein [Nisaea sp.]|uniref:hypothetical protein n=2 Tax=Alphaproteobacteria TaxID=28211 RepID=UPI0032649537